MKDVIVIAIVLAFFAICAAYVSWCERLVAADAEPVVGRAARTAGSADTPEAVQSGASA